MSGTADCYKLEDDASAWTSIATVNRISNFNGGVVIKGTDGNPDKLWVMTKISDYIFSDGTVEVGPAIAGLFKLKVDSKYPFSSLFEMLTYSIHIISLELEPLARSLLTLDFLK